MDTFKCHIPNEAHYFIVKSPILKQLYSWKWFVRKTILSVSQKNRNVKKKFCFIFRCTDYLIRGFLSFWKTSNMVLQIMSQLLSYTLRYSLITITYSDCVCVCVALVIEHAMCIIRIFICGLFGSTIFFHVISYSLRFSEKSYWT